LEHRSIPNDLGSSPARNTRTAGSPFRLQALSLELVGVGEYTRPVPSKGLFLVSGRFPNRSVLGPLVRESGDNTVWSVCRPSRAVLTGKYRGESGKYLGCYSFPNSLESSPTPEFYDLAQCVLPIRQGLRSTTTRIVVAGIGTPGNNSFPVACETTVGSWAGNLWSKMAAYHKLLTRL